MFNANPRSLMSQQADLPALYRALLPRLDNLAGNAYKPAAATMAARFIGGIDIPTDLTRQIFEPSSFGSPQSWTAVMADRFLTWRNDGASLAPILALLIDQYNLPHDHPLMAPAAMASILGSLPNDLPFHSADHTREVVTFTLALAHQHATGQPFDDMPTQMLEIFIAACIHDFMHDGFGNARSGDHTPMRLEQRALDAALPFLKLTRIPDPSWERISIMVLSTDVSKTHASGTSPSEWMRMAYEGVDAVHECPALLAPLFDDKSLAIQAALLEDADLAVSGGMPYEYARRMTALIAEETGILSPSPETLIGFIDHICHNNFITAAAKTLFGDNMKRLRTEAKEESADTIYRWS